jgi:hypothetical protein
VRRDLLVSLVNGWSLTTTVPAVLDIVEREPLASAGGFGGDLLRALMEVHGSFWTRHPRLFTRYRAAVRAGALARRALPPAARDEFWNPLAVEGEDMQPDPAA